MIISFGQSQTEFLQQIILGVPNQLLLQKISGDVIYY